MKCFFSLVMLFIIVSPAHAVQKKNETISPVQKIKKYKKQKKAVRSSTINNQSAISDSTMQKIQWNMSQLQQPDKSLIQ